MSCKPQAKSLRAANGMELMTRFAKQGGVLRATDGVAPTDQGAAMDRKVSASYTPPPTDTPQVMNKDAARGMSTGGFTMAMPSGLQLRDGGGDMTGGTGGQVPGIGHGDKIPAKYEPGEFIVSNDMLDAQPELRQHLRGLRQEVLAAKGMTPEMADAKAMGYDGGSQGEHNERAPQLQNDRQRPESGALDKQPMGGVRPVGDTRVLSAPHARGLRALDGIEVSERPWNGSADARAFSTQPGPGNPNVGPGGSDQAQRFLQSRGAPVSPPTQTVRATPVSPQSAGRQVGSMFRSPALQGAMKLSGAVSAIGEGTSAVDDAQSGNYAGALDHGLRSAAYTAATKLSPAALAGGAYLGGAAVGDHIYSKMDDTQRMGVGHVVNKGLRGVGDALGQDWGVDDSALMKMQGMDPSAPAQTTRPTTISPNPNQTAATTQRTGLRLNDQQRTSATQDPRLLNTNTSRPELGASRDFSKELNGARGPLPTDLREGVVHKTVDAQGRVTYSGRNVGQQADGSTQMVDGMGRSQKMRGSFDVAAPGSIGLTEDGAAYTPVSKSAEGRTAQLAAGKALTAATLRNPDGTAWSARDNAVMAANLRDGVDAYTGTSRQPASASGSGQDEFSNMPIKQAAMLRQQKMQGEVTKRGQDMDLEGRRMTNQSNMARMQYDMNKDLRDFALTKETHDQTVGAKAETNARTALKQYGPGKDGLQVEDPGKSAAMYDTATQVIPGFTQMNEGARNLALAQSKDLLDLFGKLQGQNQMGFDLVNPLATKKPGLSGLPNLAKGKTSQASGLRGPLTPGISNGDYFTEYADGRQVPLGNLNSRQLEMMDMAHKGMSWADILKATQGAK